MNRIQRMCVAISVVLAGMMYVGCLTPVEAQNVTCPTRPLGDNSNACASTAFVQNQVFATLPAFNPKSFNAKCDGVTDDTTAFQTMGTAIVAAGGGTVEMPANANCVIYNSGQAPGTPIVNVNVSAHTFGGLRWHGNGSLFTVGHTFVPGDQNISIVLINGANGNVWIDGQSVTQTVTSSCSGSGGTVFITSNGSGATQTTSAYQLYLTNVTMTGAGTSLFAANTWGVYVNNVKLLNTCDGIDFGDGAQDIVVTNFNTDGSFRDLILTGTSHATFDITSRNVISNAVLMYADVMGSVNSDITLNYKVLPRTVAGNPPSYVTIGHSLAGGGTANVWKDITVNLDVDVSGDTATAPVINFIKSTTNTWTLNFEVIKFHGRISGVLNNAGHIINLFSSADSPWTNTTAQGIVLEDLYISGSATPDIYIDYLPFSTTLLGGLVIDRFWMPGTITQVNSSNATVQLRSGFAYYGGNNTTCYPSFGCTGIVQPTAHSLLIAQGSAPMNTLLVGNAQLLVGQTGADPQSKAVGGDLTMLNTGAFTVAKIAGTTVSGTTGTTNVVFSASPTLTGTLTAATITASGNITSNSAGSGAFTASGSLALGNLGMSITNTSSSGNATILFNTDQGLVGGFFACGSSSCGAGAFSGPNTLNLGTTGSFAVGLTTNNTQHLYMSVAGGVFIGTAQTDAGANNLQVSGTVRGNTGFSAGASAGVSTTCTVTAGNSYVFTFGLLTTKGANCT